jgi:hypothetical protein
MLIGPSYSLQTRKASVQRCINLMLRAIEPGNEKAGFYLQQIPGLVRFATLGGEVRGALVIGSTLFVVAGSTLYEVSATGIGTVRGTLQTAAGPIDMAYGATQLVIVDGPNGYVLTLATNAFGRITDPDFYGSARVGYVDGFFIFIRPNSQQFYISAIDDASTLDALDFASSESSPDDITAVLVTQREVWLFGEVTTEVWFNAGGADFPFARVQGVTIEVGCIAPHSAQKADNSVFWLGQDNNGAGMVWRADGYKPMRISTHAVEEALSASTDLSSAAAYCYQQNGQTFYCLNVPGVEATWVYDASVGQWHERCEISGGVLSQHRALVHAYAHRKTLAGDAAGYLYSLDTDTYTNDGDVIYRERTSPHTSSPSRKRVFFKSMRLNVEAGITPQGVQPVIELQYSDDGGATWGNWIARSVGDVGQYKFQVWWFRLGQAFDRVWRVRCTDNCRTSLIGEAVWADDR